MEVLEERTLLSPYTLTTGLGDGNVTVGVDGLGSFGSALGGGHTTNADYDPIGALTQAGTTWQSAVAIRFGTSGSRQFLTSGSISLNGNLTNPTVTGTSSIGTSNFTHGGLQFALTQTVGPMFDSASARSGSVLTQNYYITNPGSSAVYFELVRFLEGDLLFDGTVTDGGGRIVRANGSEILFETDAGGTAATSTTFVGITATGGTIPTAGRYEIGQYSAFGGRISSGLPLANVVFRDNNSDGFVDAGSEFDAGLALNNLFTVAPGATVVYTTETYFGSGAPSGLNTPPVLDLAVTAPITVSENGPAVVIAPSASMADIDSANFATGLLTVAMSANGTSDDLLAIRHEGTATGQIGVSGSSVTFGGTIIGTFTGGTAGTPLVVTLNASATPVIVQSLVRNITYQVGGDNPSTLQRTISFQVSDGDGGTSAAVTALADVTLSNDPPTIANVANSTTLEDTPLAVSFTVADVDDAATSLTLSGSSSNASLVADISFSGSGANRSVTVTPAANQFGTSIITLVVTDPAGATATDTFVLNVSAVNDRPTISDVFDTSVNQNSSGSVSFVIGDAETAADSLVVSAVSSNAALIPNANLAITGSGANRGLTMTPLAGQNGTATITLTVSDGNLSASDTFLLTVAQLGSVSGLKWLDLNLNGLRDGTPLEPGLGGVTIYLDLDRDGTQDPNEPATVTRFDDLSTPSIDETGTYTFNNLVAGVYFIRELPPPGTVQSFPNPTTTAIIVSPGTNNPPQGIVTPQLISNAYATGDSSTHTVTLTLPSGQSLANMIDVFLLFDDTGSFASNAPTLSAAFNTVITNSQTSMPSVSFGFGVGRFEDYGGNAGFDSSRSRPFILSHPIVTTDNASFDAAINAAFSRTTPGGGGDNPETTIEGLYQLATGSGFDGNGNGSVLDSGFAGPRSTQLTPGTSGDVPSFASYRSDPANNILTPAGTLGGAGFRAGALPIILVAGDTGTAYRPDGASTIVGVSGVTVSASQFVATGSGRNRTPDTNGDGTQDGASVQQAIDALNALGALVIGLGTGTSINADPRRSDEAISRLTGAINTSSTPIDSGILGDPINPGDPFYFRIINGSPTSLADGITAAIQAAAMNVSFDIELRSSDPAVTINNLTGIVPNVSAGQTVSFDVQFTGDGSPHRFDLQFVRAGTQVVLGSIPVELAAITTVNSGGAQVVNLPAGATVTNINFGNAPVNDPPVNTLPAGPLDIFEHTATPITGVSIADPDAVPGTVTVTLSIPVGTLTIATGVPGGVTAGQVSNNGTGTVTINAPLPAINTTLAQATGLLYFGPTGQFGSATLTMISNDNGNSGVGGPLSDTDSLVINLLAINDPPVNQLPSTPTILEDSPLTLSTSAANAISISDLDAGSADLQVTLRVTGGTVVVGTANVTVTGNSSSLVTLLGTIPNINAALNGLLFTPAANLTGNGAASIEIITEDLGNTGLGGPQSDTDLLAINITPQNDAPQLSLIPAQVTNEDTPSAPVFFTVDDVDSPQNLLTFFVNSSNPALLTPGAVVPTGTGTQRSIILTPQPDQFGTALVTLVAIDTAGARTSSSFVLTVNAVNDAPTFTAGPHAMARADAGSFVLPGWATAISRGPGNEAGQSLQFQILSNSNPALFSVSPSIDPVTGNLSFTPRGDQFGTSNLSVRLRDNGGTDHSGADTSLVQNFIITVAVPATRRFEFNAGPTLLTPGYTSVRGTDVYDSISGPLRTFGWNMAVTEADRATLSTNSLLRDGHYGRDNTFTAEVPDGTYVVSLMLGDRSYARDRLNIYANGVPVPNLTNVSTAAGQFIHRSFQTTITNGKLQLRLQDTGGDPFWMVHALEIRPAAGVDNALTLTRVNPTGTGALDGNGVSVDTFQGTGATPNALISISSTAGTILSSQDQDPSFVGVQVRANANGQFSFQITRPTAMGNVLATFEAQETTGARNGSFQQSYIEPVSRLFDMNYGNSPTQNNPPYQGVTNSTLYSAARGFGWKSAVSGADRGATSAPDALLRDIAYGTDGTFRVTASPGAVYTVTMHFRDTFAHDKINVYIENATTPVSAGLTNLFVPANTTIRQTFIASSNDGVLDIRIRDLSTTGDRNWIVNAIDVVRNTQLASVAGSASDAGQPLTQAQLAPIVAEAKSRLAASGLTPAQLAAVNQAEFRIAPLGPRDLGLTASQPVIYLDDNGAGHGWFIDSTPQEDREFRAIDGGLIATTGPAQGRIDLLTVVMHELSHLAGKVNSDHGEPLMSPVLTPSTRRNPDATHTDRVFAGLTTTRELVLL